jgi:ankyrin repeat protein
MNMIDKEDNFIIWFRVFHQLQIKIRHMALLLPQLAFKSTLTSSNTNNAISEDLITSAFEGSTVAVSLLLKSSSANVNFQRSFDGATALHVAVERGHIGVAKQIVDESPNTDIRTAPGATPLFYAVLRGDMTLVKLLIDRGRARQEQGHIVWGLSEAMLAVIMVDLEMIEYLAENGADYYARSSYGQTWQEMATQFHNGISWDELSIIRHTIDVDALYTDEKKRDLKARGVEVHRSFCESPDEREILLPEFQLMLASSFATGGLYLKSVFGVYFPIFTDAMWYSFQQLSTQANSDEHSKVHQNIDVHGSRFAAWYAQIFAEKLEVLLSTNGRPERVPNVDDLVMAAEMDDSSLVRDLILHFGTPIDSRIDGFTPLMYAVSNNASRAISQLILLKANPLLRGVDESNILQQAVLQCDLTGVTTVLTCLWDLLGTNKNKNKSTNSHKQSSIHLTESFINEINYQVKLSGETPLFIAAQRGKHEIVALLMSYGARVDILDSNGISPLVTALSHHHYKVVQVMRSTIAHQSSLNIQNNKKWRSILSTRTNGTDGTLLPVEVAICSYLAFTGSHILGETQDNMCQVLHMLLDDSCHTGFLTKSAIQTLVTLAYRTLSIDLVLIVQRYCGPPQCIDTVENGDKYGIGIASLCVLCARFDLLVTLTDSTPSQEKSGLSNENSNDKSLFSMDENITEQHFKAVDKFNASARDLSQQLFGFPIEYGITLARASALPTAAKLRHKVLNSMDNLWSCFCDTDKNTTSTQQRVHHTLLLAFKLHVHMAMADSYQAHTFAFVNSMAIQLLRRCLGGIHLAARISQIDEQVPRSIFEQWVLLDLVPCLGLHQRFGRVTSELVNHFVAEVRGSDQYHPEMKVANKVAEAVLAHVQKIGKTGFKQDSTSFFLACEDNIIGQVAEHVIRVGPATEEAGEALVDATAHCLPPIDIDMLNEDGYTALMMAASFGHQECLCILLACKADITSVAEVDGCSSLILASSSGNIEGMKSLINSSLEPSVLDAMLQHEAAPGLSALFFASQNNFASCITLLLDAKASYETRTSTGITPLIIAAGSGNATCVRVLLDKYSTDDSSLKLNSEQSIKFNDAGVLLDAALRHNDAYLRVFVLNIVPDAFNLLQTPAEALCSF